MRFISLSESGKTRNSLLSCLAPIFIGVALTLTLATLTAMAQTDTGSVVGTVRDASGAVIAGAQVDITDAATGVGRTFVTNGDGGLFSRIRSSFG